MASDRNAFKLGLTLILFLGLFLYVMWFLAPHGKGDMPIIVRYPHNSFTTILTPGTVVICGGVPVGKVTLLELSNRKEADADALLLDVLVHVNIDTALQLRKDCRIIPEGMLFGEGGKLIIIERGTGELVQEDEVVDGEVSVTIAMLTQRLADQLDPSKPESLLSMIRAQLVVENASSFLGKVHATLDNISAVTAGLKEQLNPKEQAALMAKIHVVMNNLVATTHAIRYELELPAPADRRIIQQVHDLLTTMEDGLVTFDTILTENREPIHETIVHVRNTTRILETEIATRIAKELDVTQPASLMAKIHVALGSLGSAVDDVRTITSSARTTLVTNEKMISRAINNFKETSDHLNLASQEIRRNPWRLLYQPSIDEAEKANLFDAARAFSEAATRLDDAATRLESMSANKTDTTPTNDEQLIKLRDQLQTTFDQFSKAETALWKQLKVK